LMKRTVFRNGDIIFGLIISSLFMQLSVWEFVRC